MHLLIDGGMTMTREQIEAMTGAEVDARLAAALGIEQTNGPAGAWYFKSSGEYFCEAKAWRPREDLNQAMQAAEKVGLEIAGRLFSLTYCWKSFDSRKQTAWEGEWVACWMDGDIGEGYPTGRAPTPALAVCRSVIASWEART